APQRQASRRREGGRRRKRSQRWRAETLGWQEEAHLDKSRVVGYSLRMDDLLTEAEVAEAHERLLDAIHLQKMEGNPLDAEDIAMFEMFERERWPHERRIAYIIEHAKDKSSVAAE